MSRPALIDRARRWGGYAFWSTAAFALPLAFDRLVICPVLKRYLLDDVFGAFVWLLGIVNMIGLAAGVGFGNYLMREFPHQTAEQARVLLRNALTLAAVVGAAAILVGGTLSFGLADEVVRAHAWELYVPLGVFAVVRCVEWMLLTTLRIRRMFVTVFALKVAETLVLLSVLPLAPSRNLWLFGSIYVASVLVPLGLGAYLCRAEIGRGAWYEPRVAWAIMVGWCGLAASGLIEQSLVYLPRTVLGILQEDIAAVTILFQGTSIGNVFVMPVGLGGGIVLSLLATKKHFALRGKMGIAYLAVSLALAAGVGVASYVGGRWLICHLYPDSAEQTLAFYHWIAIANAEAAVIVLMRPVAIRYLRVRNLVLLAASSLTLQLVALVILVPTAGARGAAIALTLSSLLAMVLWCGAYVRLCAAAERQAAEPPDAETPAPEA